jgi:hypothetical protein
MVDFAAGHRCSKRDQILKFNSAISNKFAVISWSEN